MLPSRPLSPSGHVCPHTVRVGLRASFIFSMHNPPLSAWRVPFLNGAPPPDGDWPRPKPAWWVRQITRFKIKYALLAIGMAAVAYALLAIFYGPSAYSYGEGGTGLASAPDSGATTTFFPLGATIDRLHKDATEECWMRLCASSSAKLGGHACWSCGLTECEFLVLSQVVHVDVAIGLHPVFVGFDGERGRGVGSSRYWERCARRRFCGGFPR